MLAVFFYAFAFLSVAQWRYFNHAFENWIKSLAQALPALVSNLEMYRQNTKYGQVGFFELGGGESDMLDFELPNVSEFPKAELLAMEKEMTGLFLSGHPMDKYEDFITKTGCARTFEVLDASKGESKYRDGNQVTLCGIISHITVKQTRTNKENMAFVTVEDLYGSIEVILFPKTFSQYSSLLSEGSVIGITGTLSLEEEKDAKLLVNSLFTPDLSNPVIPENRAVQQRRAPVQQKKQPSKRAGLYLKFTSKSDERIHKAEIITSIFEGNTPLYYYFEDEGRYIRQPSSSFTEINPTMLSELKRLLGDKNVAVIQ